MLGTALTSGDPRIFHELVHPSGEFSARFLIVAMMATPLAMLLRGWRGPIWLKKNRRYLGVLPPLATLRSIPCFMSLIRGQWRGLSTKYHASIFEEDGLHSCFLCRWRLL